jgi:hypothetical protein
VWNRLDASRPGGGIDAIGLGQPTEDGKTRLSDIETPSFDQAFEAIEIVALATGDRYR